MSRIALLLPELEGGGAQRVMLLLAREFVENNHRVDLVLLQATGPLLSVVPEGVKIVDLAARRPSAGQLGFVLISMSRLASWIWRERPDALLSTLTGANLVALLSRKLARIPLRLVIREAAPLTHVGRLRLAAMRWLYPHADAVIALNGVMADNLAARIGIPASRIRCIANPVDAAYVREQARAPLSHCWLADRNVRVIVSVGRLIPQKDYATLLEAFSLVPRTFSARLLIVGEGPERATLEALATRLAIEDRMQLIGFDLNPWRWMARADVFALSSRSEGSPNALIEALTLGVPTVAVEYDSSVRDLAAQYELNVVRPGDPAALALALQGLLNNRLHSRPAAKTGVRETAWKYLDALGCNRLETNPASTES